MSQAQDILNNPKLVDSSISCGIITFNSNENPRHKIMNITMHILDNKNKITQINTDCDYYTAININYKLKSALNNIEDTIKNYNNN